MVTIQFRPSVNILDTKPLFLLNILLIKVHNFLSIICVFQRLLAHNGSDAVNIAVLLTLTVIKVDILYLKIRINKF